MISEIVADLKNSIDRSLDALKKHLGAIRTGRAHVSLLESVRIDYYGTPTPLSSVSTLTASDARTLMVKPWEKGLQKTIEKAILEANLGLTAVTDGDVVRVPVPQLTEERRKEFCKQARVKAEEAKLAVRNARRDANDLLKAATKDGEISEDEEKRGLKMVQDATDASVSTIDDLLSKKEEEIMTV
ncbi:MAG TPA: ribosome recycling factor [Myxococcota bacterium]|nr:ribosome recycling factor [Myxococcota bacterium]